MSRFGIQQLKANGTLYPGFSGETIVRGFDVNTDQTDGVQYETMQHILQVKPGMDATSLNLKAMITLLASSTDLPLLTLDGVNGVQFVGGKANSGLPGYLGGSVHTARTAINGLIYMAGVRWSPAQRAEMSLKGMFFSTDGTTASIAQSLVALPTQAVPDNGFALAAMTVNAATIGAVNSVDLTCDPKFEYDYTAGLPEPTGINGAGARGALGIRLRADIGDADLANGTGSVSLLFKRYANGGGFGTDSVTFTLNGNFSYEDQVGGSAGSPIGKQLVVIPTWNGTVKPLVITTT